MSTESEEYKKNETNNHFEIVWSKNNSVLKFNKHGKQMEKGAQTIQKELI